MTRQQAIEKLTPGLTLALRDWLHAALDDDETSRAVGWVGDDCARLMAKAALAVLESSADVQDYLIKEKLLEA